MKKWIVLFVLWAGVSAGAQQTRSLWVTRWAFRSAQDIEQIMDRAAALNIHVILLQVRGAGSTVYPSEFEPRDSLFTQPQGRDPLRVAVDAAHQRGLQLHAWVNVYPGASRNAWQNPRSILDQHPDWIIRDVYGFSLDVNKSYLWLSPTHPQVGDHLFRLLRELYTNYNIDGLHLDYLRFPTINTSFDEPSLRLFRQAVHSEPDQRPDEWSRFRRDAITALLRRVRNDLRVVKPRLVVSAAVVSDLDRAKNVYQQDGAAWLAADLVDALYPMIYTSDPQVFGRELKRWLRNSHGRHIYAGIDLSQGEPAKQLRLIEELGAPGAAFFSFDNLVAVHEPAAKIADLSDAVPVAMPWKEYLRDTQGPLITDIRTIPSPLTPGKPFKIAAKLTDPSGIFDGKSNQGVRLSYRVPSGDSSVVRMKRVTKTHDWFITGDLPPQPPGSVVSVQITAYDDCHESALAPNRNRGVSEAVELPVLMPDRTYVRQGTVGPLLWNPCDPAVDDEGKVWVSSEKDGPLLIFDRDGKPAPFSPIRFGVTLQNDRVTPAAIVGLARGADKTMLVACNTQPPIIFRFDIESGAPLPGFELALAVGGIATDSQGRMFVLEKNTSGFYVFSAVGVECGGPFGGGSVAGSIAVLPNAGMVFITDRSHNVVQRWYGAVEGEYAQYWPAQRIKSVNLGLGDAAVAGDLLYVCETPRNLISIYDRTGTIKGHLIGEASPLIQPRAVAFSPNAERLYLLGETGGGATQLHCWQKRR